jgi:hypothetical protein
MCFQIFGKATSYLKRDAWLMAVRFWTIGMTIHFLNNIFQMREFKKQLKFCNSWVVQKANGVS